MFVCVEAFERGTLLQKITFYCFKLIAFYNRFYIDYNEQLKQYYQISAKAYLGNLRNPLRNI